MTFDPGFVFYRDDREIEALETLGDMSAEADAELAWREQSYPERVAKGRLAAEDAERELRVMTALADGLARRHPRRAVASWTEIIHCLRREILYRREIYPRWIAAGRVEQAEADRKLRMIESIHDMEWRFVWTDEAKAGRAATQARAAA